MYEICPIKLEQYTAQNQLPRGDVFDVAPARLALTGADVFCNPVTCDSGPELVDRHRYSPMRLIGSTQYKICPVPETAVQLSVQA